MADVLFVANSLPPKMGGVERHLAQVAVALRKRGHTVEFFELGPTSEAIAEISSLRATLASGRHDIVHAHDFTAAIISWAAFRTLRTHQRRPLFLTTHGYESFPLKLRYVVAHRFAHAVARGSIAIGAYIDKWYGTKSNVVLHGGVTAGSAFEPRTKVSFVSRLAPDTNAIAVTRSFARLAKSAKGKTFVIGGFGPDSNQIASLAHGADIDFLGAVVEPAKIFAESSCVVANSYLAILEALAAGAIVVAVADNALKADYLREMAAASGAVFVCSPNELETALAHALSLSDDELLRLRSRAAQYTARLSWDNVAGVYEGLWFANTTN